VNNNPDTQMTTTYVAPSGALVFACGSHAWTFGLDTFRWSASGTPYVVPGIQKLLANIMPALLQGKNAQTTQTAQAAFNSYHS
jgi:hypothetical protein